MNVIRVIDVSEFTREIAPSWWRRIRDQQGVEAAVIQAWGGGPEGGRENVYFSQNLAGARSAGLGVAAYVWPPGDYKRAIEHIGEDKRHLAFLALDMEAGRAVTMGMVGGVVAAGLRPVIYTNPNDWRTTMQDTREFGNLPLWLARYHWRAVGDVYALRWDVKIDKAFGSAARVGGWERDTDKLIGWQFTGTANLYKEQVDLSYFYASAFEMNTEDDMTDEERRQLEALVIQDGWNRIFIGYHTEQIAAMQKAIAEMGPGDDMAALKAKVAANTETIEEYGARVREAAAVLGG